MIDKRELRIGNKVAAPKHGLAIATIQGMTTNNIVMLEEVSTYDFFSEIEPIPVTSEWLYKFGFVYTRDGEYKKEGFDQLADYGGQAVVVGKGNAYLSCGYYENQIDCAFVHQLQNLYFRDNWRRTDNQPLTILTISILLSAFTRYSFTP